MPSHTSRSARTFAGLALALASAAVLAGCATVDPVVLPDADSGDGTSPATQEVKDLTDEYNSLREDFANGFINVKSLIEQQSSACLVELEQDIEDYSNALNLLGEDQLATIQNQASSGQTPDPVLVKQVMEGLATATTNNASAQQQLDVCGGR